MTGREDIFRKAMNEGHSAAWDQMWDKAAASYRAALEEFPDNPKALSSLGLALYQLQDFNEALTVYERAAKISPNDPIPYEKIAQLNKRLGNLKAAVAAAMKAADLYLNQRDVEKAIENWARVIQLNPEHLLAHSRLALAHERMGHKQRAVTEYLAVASLLQRAGKLDKAMEIIERAEKLAPENKDIREAKALLKTGRLLPKPLRPKGGTGPIRIAKVKQLNAPKKREQSGADPIEEARQKALTILAEILFDYTDDSEEAKTRRGLQAIVRGTGELSLQKIEQAKIVSYLGQAIDAQTHHQDEEAAVALERAMETGFSHPAVYFLLGALRSKSDRLESALRHLQHAVQHKDFGLAARLIIGDILKHLGRYSDAVVSYLEALKEADSAVVPQEQVDSIRQLYEPLIEAASSETDTDASLKLCNNIADLLLRPNWRERIREARKQLPQSEKGDFAVPLAEILIQTESSKALEAIGRVHELARMGKMRSAMDEAFQALNYAPTYLPLHTLIGDLLIREGRTEEAISKYNVIAQAYSVRGEAEQATNFLRRVIKLAPMDLSARTNLIDQLIARGKVDEAINEYLELADIYYRLAELDMARKTYATALRQAQQSNADRTWNIRILQRMADIDLQRLDWRRAVRVFEQIRTLRPDDEEVRARLVDLNLRLGRKEQAFSELENYVSYLAGSGKNEDAVKFIESVIEEHSDTIELRRFLADAYIRIGKNEEAIAELDAVGESLLEVGDKDGALEAIAKIISLSPPNVEEYQRLLAKIQQEY
jgi:tetratricopeptide (TPR) repeat protein